MPSFIWTASVQYASAGDETAFFSWLRSVPGVIRVEGRGRELHVHLRSSRVSESSLRELRALYRRYQGNAIDLEVLNIASNRSAWFKVFGSEPTHQVVGVALA